MSIHDLYVKCDSCDYPKTFRFDRGLTFHQAQKVMAQAGWRIGRHGHMDCARCSGNMNPKTHAEKGMTLGDHVRQGRKRQQGRRR